MAAYGVHGHTSISQDELVRGSWALPASWCHRLGTSPFEHGLKGIRGCLCDVILSRVAWSGVPGLLAGIGTGYEVRVAQIFF